MKKMAANSFKFISAQQVQRKKFLFPKVLPSFKKRILIGIIRGINPHQDQSEFRRIGYCDWPDLATPSGQSSGFSQEGEWEGEL